MGCGANAAGVMLIWGFIERDRLSKLLTYPLYNFFMYFFFLFTKVDVSTGVCQIIFAGSWQTMRGNFSKAGWQEGASAIKAAGKAWYQTMISDRLLVNRIQKLLKGWLAGGGICNKGIV